MDTKPHFSILATSFAGGPRPRNAALILGGLWLLLFFAALFAPPLLDDADATHAQAALSMLHTGDLVTLHVDGIRYLEKAPLPYWLTAASFALFGANTFAAHLPLAFAVLLLALLGHRWANYAFGSRTAFYTALGLLTAPGVFLFTRILIPEVWLSLFLAAALYAFLRSVEPAPAHSPVPEVPTGKAPPERPALTFALPPATYPYLMWTALALAVLTKGLVALVLFGAPALLYFALTSEFRKLKLLRPLSGLLLFLLIAAPWHVLAALRNPATAQHHGFLWFYFWNEHVLRFLGQRTPADFNKMPGYLFWAQHLAWLFPWTLFLPLGIAAIWRRFRHQTATLTRRQDLVPNPKVYLLFLVLAVSLFFLHNGRTELTVIILTLAIAIVVIDTRRKIGLNPSPFHRIDTQQKSILLLGLFAGAVLLFFSLSTNQEYYTFPAYLPLLLLIASTITRAEQTYSSSPSSQRWIAFAHTAFTAIGALVALALVAGLWSSRHLPYTPDIGTLLAHRSVGDYTLSMSHLFDLTGPSFAALRLPAVLAAIVFATGPALASALRMQRRHLAATTTIAFTAGAFLFAAHLAFARFAPLLSSKAFATTIQHLDTSHQTPVLIFGDQAFGSSLIFYLDRPVTLVDGRSTSMLFGSTFPDASHLFLTPAELRTRWSDPDRQLLFVPAERRAEVNLLLGSHQYLLREESGKALITNHP